MIERSRQPRLYLDTNVFIYAFEGDATDVGYMLEFFDFLQHRKYLAVTSELTLAELSAPAQGMTSDRRLIYEGLLLGMDFIELLPVSRQILMDTIDLRKQLHSKLLDSIHIATAQRADCRYLVSADKRLFHSLGDMVRIPPDVANIKMLLDSLRV